METPKEEVNVNILRENDPEPEVSGKNWLRLDALAESELEDSYKSTYKVFSFIDKLEVLDSVEEMFITASRDVPTKNVVYLRTHKSQGILVENKFDAIQEAFAQKVLVGGAKKLDSFKDIENLDNFDDLDAELDEAESIYLIDTFEKVTFKTACKKARKNLNKAFLSITGKTRNNIKVLSDSSKRVAIFTHKDYIIAFLKDTGRHSFSSLDKYYASCKKAHEIINKDSDELVNMVIQEEILEKLVHEKFSGEGGFEEDHTIEILHNEDIPVEFLRKAHPEAVDFSKKGPVFNELVSLVRVLKNDGTVKAEFIYPEFGGSVNKY